MHLKCLLPKDRGISISFQRVKFEHQLRPLRKRCTSDTPTPTRFVLQQYYIYSVRFSNIKIPTQFHCKMLFQVVNWLTFVCLLRTGLTSPLDHVIPSIENGLISLTTHLNTTNLTIPICNNPFPGHQPTFFDCTRTVNSFRFAPTAHYSVVWTVRDAIAFKAREDSCQVLLVPSLRDSTDVFALMDIAQKATSIIARCIQRETGTTRGGTELVGPKAEFQVFVTYVEPNQSGNR